MDPFTIMMLSSAAGGGMGMLNQKAQKEKDYRDMMANSEIMRYSPWSGMQTSYQGGAAGSNAGAIGQGALSGAMFGSQFGGGKPIMNPTDNSGTWAAMPRSEKTAFYSNSKNPYATNQGY